MFFGRLGGFLLMIGLIIFVFQFSSWFMGYSERVVNNVNLLLGLSIIGGQSLLAGLLGQLIVNLGVSDGHFDARGKKEKK